MRGKTINHDRRMRAKKLLEIQLGKGTKRDKITYDQVPLTSEDIERIKKEIECINNKKS
jgi:hypothetical protein